MQTFAHAFQVTLEPIDRELTCESFATQDYIRKNHLDVIQWLELQTANQIPHVQNATFAFEDGLFHVKYQADEDQVDNFANFEDSYEIDIRGKPFSFGWSHVEFHQANFTVDLVPCDQDDEDNGDIQELIAKYHKKIINWYTNIIKDDDYIQLCAHNIRIKHIQDDLFHIQCALNTDPDLNIELDSLVDLDEDGNHPITINGKQYLVHASL